MIPHLEQQIEFLTACRDHGAENVEWKFIHPRNAHPQDWKLACNQTPAWVFDITYEFRVRVRPRKIYTKRVEIPRPMTEAPEDKSMYYVPSLPSRDLYFGSMWDNDLTDKYRLSIGICYATPKDAAAAARAMLAREEE